MIGRRVRIVVVAAFVLALVFVIGWALTYPFPSDPKNIRYVLWKAGLYRMDADNAAIAMVGDPGSKKMVVGKTREELQSRFGRLLTLAEASPYYKFCYQTSSLKGSDVLFIGRSPWMIVLKGDRAADLMLLKGC
jgi:hypothetical protein